ncbi:MAG: patatin-like phospholipase family protein [Methylocystis sp.]
MWKSYFYKKRYILPILFTALALYLWKNEKIDRQPAVPNELRLQAQVLGLKDIRAFPDQIDTVERVQRASLIREAKYLGIPRGGMLPSSSALILSGGGDNGAFGAGLLAGWSARGDRPVFRSVTGVSTGALIAPFAFLGPDYDKTLTQLYTAMDAAHVFHERFLPLAATVQDALSDTDPLFNTISQYLTDEMLAKIAGEREKGRLLLIQTADVDAGRAVFWDITAIAASNHPEALHLVHKILLASAAIPLAFPPVFFDVEIDGKKYQEMHVDGGAVSQIFSAPAKLDFAKIRQEVGVKRKSFDTYIIRNSRLHPDWSETTRHTLTIAQKAVSLLINYNGVGDLYKAYMLAKRQNSSFNLAFIKDDFEVAHKDDFEPEYMKALYNYGYKLAKEGYAWDHGPPGFDPHITEAN